ncbi:phage Gp37/Gp68 family protein [Burkholderia ambifaria]|uniref:phage Gp37/Gp68 family protein n=1 Tax=Burkholderia ambifaria TaxID=152480 RepID=UPI00158A3943|nr:phage Gp37/Gp68 family protein [Burkholderia ambifaria]
MSENSKIEWCDHTFNPFIGCTKVSPGCDHCYAEHLMDTRMHKVVWGPHGDRVRTSPANWRKPLAWNAQPFVECVACHWRGARRNFVRRGPNDLLWEMCPVCSSADFTPARARVFCASLADVFDNSVDPAWRADLFRLIADTPNLDWLLLTKRIGNVTAMLHEIGMDRLPDNVWLGATIVNQAEADRDIPKLLAVSARVRFLSMEPLLGPVDLTSIPWRGHRVSVLQGWNSTEHGSHWVIVGGESGHGARPMHPDWARTLRDQCAAAGVPFLFKQWGEWLPVEPNGAAVRGCGVTPVREPAFRFAANHHFTMVGKKAAGRHLDGRTHDEFPFQK